MKILPRENNYIWLAITLFLMLCFSVFLLLQNHSHTTHRTTKTMRVIGYSMEPNLHHGQSVEMSSEISHLKRWDIIAFYLQTRGNLVKRVIALPWDTVIFGKDGYIWINGEKQEESYTRWIKFDPKQIRILLIQLEQYQQKIPQGMILAFGDNRWVSLDSGEYGMISEDQVIGKIITNP